MLISVVIMAESVIQLLDTSSDISTAYIDSVIQLGTPLLQSAINFLFG
jgi:hypothetical protein